MEEGFGDDTAIVWISADQGRRWPLPSPNRESPLSPIGIAFVIQTARGALSRWRRCARPLAAAGVTANLCFAKSVASHSDARDQRQAGVRIRDQTMGPTASRPGVVAFRDSARPDLARSLSLVASAFAQTEASAG
jgi:hypothetical protein